MDPDPHPHCSDADQHPGYKVWNLDPALDLHEENADLRLLLAVRTFTCTV
jgi:hypothetical protein